MSNQSKRQQRHKRKWTKLQRERRLRERCIEQVKKGELPLCYVKVQTYHGADRIWGLFGEDGSYVEVPRVNVNPGDETSAGQVKAWDNLNKRLIVIRRATEDEVLERLEMAEKVYGIPYWISPTKVLSDLNTLYNDLLAKSHAAVHRQIDDKQGFVPTPF